MIGAESRSRLATSKPMGSTMSLRKPFLGLLALTATACNLVIGLGEFTDGAPLVGGGGGDGAATLGGGGSGGEPDRGGSPSPGGADQGGGGASEGGSGGGAAGFCATHTEAFYCEDFDDLTSPGQIGWVNLVGQAGDATLGLDTSSSASPPKSLRSFTDGAQSPQSASAGKSFGPAPGAMDSVTLESDIQVDIAPTTVQTVGIGMSFTSGGDTELHHVMLLMDDSQIGINEGYIPSDGGPFTAFPAVLAPYDWNGSSEYHHLKITIEKGAPYVATLEVDGASVVTLELTAPFSFLSDTNVQMGVGYNAGGSALSCNVDNILLTKSP